MLHVSAYITARPGMRDVVLDEFRANMPAAHAEEGCIVCTGCGCSHLRPLQDRAWTGYLRGCGEMGESRSPECSRSLGPHKGLCRKDRRHDREPRNPRPLSRLALDPSHLREHLHAARMDR